MSNCTECKFAEWKRTAAGRLHPSGVGKCHWKYEPKPIAASYSWIGWQVASHPTPNGGYINRKDERDLARTRNCPVFQKAVKP
jgi:hypothetical protein